MAKKKNSIKKKTPKNETLIEAWLTGRAESTKKTYRFHFNKFLKHYGLTASKVLQQATKNKIKLKEMINGWYVILKDEHKISHNNARLSISAIKSFLSHNEIKIKTLKHKTPRKYERENMRAEHIKKLVEAAPHLRDKALIILAFQTGISIADILRLNYSDVKDAIEMNGTELEVQSLENHNKTEKTIFYENMGVITYIREKSAIKDISVLGSDSLGSDSFLRKYLNWRKENGEQLTLDTPLFISIHTVKDKKPKRLETQSAQRMIKKTMVKAGIITFKKLKTYRKFNPYGFHAIRKAFSSIAAIKGLPQVQVDLSMAHKLPYNAGYSGFEPKELIENYQKVERYLSINADQYELEEYLAEKTEDQNEKIQTQQDEIDALKSELEILNTRFLSGDIRDLINEKEAFEKNEKFREALRKTIREEIKAELKSKE